LKLIHGFNAKLLAELKKVAEEWTSESCIGETFVKRVPFLKMYADYSNKYEDALGIFTSLMEKKESFRLVLPFASSFLFLIMISHARLSANVARSLVVVIPSQIFSSCQSSVFLAIPCCFAIWLPKRAMYVLAVVFIANAPDDITVQKHADYPQLLEAIQLIEDVAGHVNEQVRRTENQKRVEEFQEKGVQLGPLIKPYRYMIKEGVVKISIGPSECGTALRSDVRLDSPSSIFVVLLDPTLSSCRTKRKRKCTSLFCSTTSLFTSRKIRSSQVRRALLAARKFLLDLSI